MIRLTFEANDNGEVAFRERELGREFNLTRHQVRMIYKSLIDNMFLKASATLSTNLRPPVRPTEKIVTICNNDCYDVNFGEPRPVLRPTFDQPSDQCLTLNVNSEEEDGDMKVEIKGEVFDIKAFVKYWNKTMTENQAVIPTILRVGASRKGMILARVREFGKKALAEVTNKAAVSDFLNGRNNQGFVANFDWVFKPKIFPKVLEGNYDNKNGTTNIGTNSARVQEQQQRANEAVDLIQDLLTRK